MNDKISVRVILTCHNRKDTTLKCIETIYDEKLEESFLIVDDGSNDGTAEAVLSLGEKLGLSIKIIKGSGSLFWAGGMRLGMEEELRSGIKSDYIALVNDDVEFVPGALMAMIERSRQKDHAVISGATSWHGADKGSYGGVRYDFKKAEPKQIEIDDADSTECDTMNCNCVIMLYDVFKKAGAFDSHYTHSMADYDYGFKLKKMGYHIYLTDFYVGYCDDNSSKGTWRDPSLSRSLRLKKKESPKGLPFSEWYYYLKKNFGLGIAIWHSLTPYIRILIGK